MKVVFRGCLVLLVALLAAAAIVTYLTASRAEEIKEAMLRQAEQRLGRNVEAGGFGGNPFTGFHVSDVIMSGPSPGAPDSLAIDRLSFRLSFRDLFAGRLVFSYISLHKPTVYVEKKSAAGHSLSDVIENTTGASGAVAGKSGRPVENKRRVIVNRINVRDGILVLKTENEEGNTREFDFRIGRISAEPVAPGDMRAFAIDGEASHETLELGFAGRIDTAAEDAFDIKWKTNKLPLNDAPSVLDEIKAALDEYGTHTHMQAEGTLTGSAGDVVVDADVHLSDTLLLDQAVGDGSANITVRPSEIKYEGAVGGEKTGVAFNGGLASGEQKSFRLETGFKGIDARKAVRKLMPDLPEVVTGSLSGKAFLSGPEPHPDKLELASSIKLENGRVNYPTPTLDRRTGAWAPIEYDTITARIFHTRPKLEIRDFKMNSSSVTAEGNGALEYRVDADTGAAAGPMNFSLSASVDSPQVRSILMQNPYLGPFISGAFNGSGSIRGVTNDAASLTGDASFVMTRGVVNNPYADRTESLRINETLSHFEFDSLEGRFDVAGENVRIAALELVSRVIDMSMKGDVGFDGSLSARADTSVKPALLEKISEFSDAVEQLDKLKDMRKVETSFNLSGTLTQPEIDWDVEHLLKKEAEKLIESRTDKLIDKVLEKSNIDTEGKKDVVDKLKDKVKDRLKNLF